MQDIYTEPHKCIWNHEIMETQESWNHIWIQEVCFKSPFDQHHFVLNIQNLHWTSWIHLKSWNYGDSRIMESYFNPWSLFQKSLWPAPLCAKYAEFALNFINTFEIMKLLRLKNHGINFKSMKFTSKVIMKLIAVWQAFCVNWICVSEIKSSHGCTSITPGSK